MANRSLVWEGDVITDEMRQAQILGVNATMGAAVVHAKENHDWKNRTGVLEGSVNIAEYAAPIDGGVQGAWGSQDVVYALAQELGATIVAKNAKALAIPLPDGGVAFAKSVTLPARPFLRPAGDATYPSLPANIGKAYRKLEKAGG